MKTKISIQKAKKQDIIEISDILYNFFPVHNIFKSKSKSKKFIKEKIKEFLIAKKDKEIVGTIRIVRRKQIKNHYLIEFKHIASKGKDKEVLKILVNKAEEIAKPGKIEIHIADSEIPDKGFFQQLGYNIEGKLKDHYRLKETCYVLGKSIK